MDRPVTVERLDSAIKTTLRCIELHPDLKDAIKPVLARLLEEREKMVKDGNLIAVAETIVHAAE